MKDIRKGYLFGRIRKGEVFGPREEPYCVNLCRVYSNFMLQSCSFYNQRTLTFVFVSMEIKIMEAFFSPSLSVVESDLLVSRMKAIPTK